MLTGYVVRIYPTEEQESRIRRSGGSCRFLYNALLSWEKSVYEKEKRFVSEYELNSYILDLKKEYPWLAEVNAQSLQQVSRHIRRSSGKKQDSLSSRRRGTETASLIPSHADWISEGVLYIYRRSETSVLYSIEGLKGHCAP